MTFEDLFRAGKKFIEFLEESDETYKNKMKEILDNIKIENKIKQSIESINKSINILAFAEAWCPDCQINLPAVYILTTLNENIKLSIVSRDGNEEFLSRYKVNGKPKIPTFIIMDDEFNEMGSFIEIPGILKDIISRGNQPEIIVAKRKYKKGEYCKDTLLDILKIIGH
ncbi:Thioredoxin [Alkalithermobacter thermoalcaliphilus JW-YL-7 = DSM 7308]|uniref:Thioredoxin n=1 Tax=Alkalithermobacter thermoalcaliphilus JW-YL-7 = DSM 7308 TaxID=1121328 RepID=A0A150FMR7_CLOPD|nr:hypothetical protein JWYL7_0012 [[Clostridium] paradoxum JW-YL-7 = DSM 7308]SHL26716.1 Thioredoxin [[Clostridium] paradoxum JW-YL-7 = DSM 7308]